MNQHIIAGIGAQAFACHIRLAVGLYLTTKDVDYVD